MSDLKITLPAGRYFVGDVGGVSRPYVAIPARSSVFYSDCGAVEIEIAGGGSCMPDVDAFSIFGVCDADDVFGSADCADENGVIELTYPTEVVYNFDYLEIVNVLKFSVCRDAGLKFTSTEEEFDGASFA